MLRCFSRRPPSPLLVLIAVYTNSTWNSAAHGGLSLLRSSSTDRMIDMVGTRATRGSSVQLYYALVTTHVYSYEKVIAYGSSVYYGF